jgi:hypothetical protein
MEKIAADCPKAITFLDMHHKLIWSRSKFPKQCKFDYVNNNILECFNNWINGLKELPIDYLMDKIRVMIQEKIDVHEASDSQKTSRSHPPKCVA